MGSLMEVHQAEPLSFKNIFLHLMGDFLRVSAQPSATAASPLVEGFEAGLVAGVGNQTAVFGFKSHNP